VIRIDSLQVVLGGRPVIHDVSANVPAQQWLALVGPNGAGKTTLLRALSALLPFDGDIHLDGREVRAMRRRDLARMVAYVPQQPQFPSDMSVADYALLGRMAHLRPLRAPTTHDREICAAVLTRMGLMSFADRRLGTLSGGERQRLVLARALAQQAPVLLLDEPTSALDLGRRVDALELVDELRLERALTVVSAVHDLTLAGQFADLLALMDRGRLVATGSPAEVLREDVLGEIYDASVRVIDDDGHLIVTSQRWGSWAREEIR
jgi:iron complex transport system ATP-binding protein